MKSNLMRQFFLSFTILFSLYSCNKENTLLSYPEPLKVRLINKDTLIEFYTLKEGKAPQIKQKDIYYAWFKTNSIHYTKGDFEGRLLNGPYKEYYPGRELKQKGAYYQGLKEGIWQSWNETGDLLQSETWNKGSKSGYFTEYNNKGNLTKKIFYKNDRLDGESIEWLSDSSYRRIVYKNGEKVADSTMNAKPAR